MARYYRKSFLSGIAGYAVVGLLLVLGVGAGAWLFLSLLWPYMPVVVVVLLLVVVFWLVFHLR